MNTCDQFRESILDHLYGLLDAKDEAELSRHLAGCGACQAEMARAERQKKLLGVAARTQITGFQFSHPESDVNPERVRRPIFSLGVRWAIAAGLLLAVAGVGLPGAYYWQKEERVAKAESRIQEVQKSAEQTRLGYLDRLARAEAALHSVEKEIQEASEDRNKRINEIWTNVNSQRMNVAVTGPQTLEPGAPNPFRIVTTDLNGRPTSAKLDVKVVNQEQEVLFKKENLASTGNEEVHLPADLPVSPQSELSLVVIARSSLAASAAPGELTEKIKLAAPNYVTHLATDKPMYQPGETVHFRSLTLDRFNLKPATEDLHLVYTLIRPTGERIEILRGRSQLLQEKDKSPFLGPDRKPVRGIGAGDYVIDPASPGGEYTINVSEANNRFPSQDRKFIVNRYEKPRLNKELEFTAKAYGPGDSVMAACKAGRVEGGLPVAGQPVTAKVSIDGREYGPDGQPGAAFQLRTDDSGAVNVKFKLPAQIQTGQATLSVTFQDQGVTEVLVRPIPIVLKKLNIEFFPEGGDLVAGVPNRVYFQARTTLDKPAELKGRIVDHSGREVAPVETFNDPGHPEANQGMGVFSFMPKIGETYLLKIDNPVGIESQHLLPAAKGEGVVLTIDKGVIAPDDPISVKVQSPDRDRSLIVGAYCRRRLLAHQPVEVKKGETKDVQLLSGEGAGGVVRVTVFEQSPGKGDRHTVTPRAERLIYRTPKEHLNLEIKSDKAGYVPGDRVKVLVKGTKENQDPAPAVVMLAVVDKSVLKLADEKTYRSMPAHVLLTSEVRRPEDLEHADFLLGQGPSAAKALDLLLGTQGWRRFAEQNPTKFREERGEDAQRLLVLNGQFRTQSKDYAQNEIQEVEKEFQVRWADMQGRLTGCKLKVHEAQKSDRERAYLFRLMHDSENAKAEYRTASSALGEFKDFLRSVYLPGARIVLLLLAGLTLVMGFVRRITGGSVPLFVLGTCCLLLFAVAMFVPRDVMQPGPMAAKGVSGDLAESDKLPGEDQIAKFDLDLRAVEKENLLGVDAPQGRMMQGAGGKMGAFGGGMGLKGGNGLQLGDRGGEVERLREAAPKAGAAPPPPAAAEKPGMPQANFRFEAKPAQDLNRNQDLKFDKKRDFEPKDEAKGKDLLQLQLRAGLEKQKADKALKAPQVQGLGEELAKRALIQDGKDARAGAGFAPGGLAVPEQRMMDRMEGMGGPAMAGRRKVMARGLGAAQFDGAALAQAEPIIVREYAHVHKPSENNTRTDFAETLFWQPALVLPDGQAEVSFDLCDSVTTFQVLTAGHTLDGRIAEATAELTSRKPLVLQPKLPIEVTDGDRIDVPLSIANNTGNQQSVNLRVQSDVLNLIAGKEQDRLTLHPEERARRVYGFVPNIIDDEAKLRFMAETAQKDISDSIESRIRVVPQGFPIVSSQSDLLEGAAKNDVVLPESWIPGTLKYQVSFYPSTLADLQKGLEAMLREPCGCFEQTSTSNYPNLLVLNYLKETDQAKPEIARRAQDLLARGYQMLTSFECLDQGKNQKQGYEWFGGTAPAHEALTAYGLMEFRDMAKVYDVDKGMVERTQKYLMNQKDGQGGFKRNPRALDTFGRAPDHITNAYIVWALTESGPEDDVTKELTALSEKAKTSKDPYFLALVAHSQLNRGQQDEGIALLKKISEIQKQDGHLDALETSITGSGGRDLQIETTALALHAWLKAKRPELFNKNIQSAVKWIGQQRGGFGGFGSTQSTILALKALIAYAKANKKTADAGDLIVYLADKEVARKHFPAGAEEAVTLELKDADRLLKSGKNSLRVEATGKNAFPYTATWSYRSLKPASADQCPVKMTTKLDRETAGEGDTVRLTVAVENKSGKGQGMTVAIVGLPAGLTLPEDMKQLKDMARLRNNGTERGEIDAWETRGRELVLYWRDLAPDKKIEVNVQLICRVPGEYQGPAGRAYLYYNADTKCWVEPLKMKIQPKE
jgi:uncharacterized protein YfaS (alpha-2-macroglobulin family)